MEIAVYVIVMVMALALGYAIGRYYQWNKTRVAAHQFANSLVETIIKRATKR